MDNGKEPATKADLNALRDELLQAVREALLESQMALREEFLGAIHGMEKSLREEFLEAIHDTETRLLRAFYDFAETNQKRLGEVERTGLVIFDRLATMERRITEVEKRLNMPPAS